jgi:recombination protein RecA
MIRERIDVAADKPTSRKSKKRTADGAPREVTFLPSGCTVLDQALGGGWAERRIINIVGDKSAGKTLLAMEGSANHLYKYRKDGRVKYKECESAFDPRYMSSLGMPMDRIEFGERIHTIEDMFDDIRDTCKLKVPTLEIVDSLDALTDQAELDRQFGDATYGTEKARNLSKLFRMLTADMERSHLTLMIISQVRSKIGFSVGRSTMRTGGRALDFYASQVVFLQLIETLKRKIKGIERPTALKIMAKLDKNKVGPPLREACFNIRFGYGIDDLASCMLFLKEVGALKDVGCSTDVGALTEFIKRINNVDTEREYREQLAPIQAAVRARWDEIEKGFLPTRRKYNGS